MSLDQRPYAANCHSTGEQCGLLERLPKWLVCFPLVLQWLWLAGKYKSSTLPSAANSNITAGGLIGEGKLEYFEGMGNVARAAVARYVSLRTESLPSREELEAVLKKANLGFPLIAKPDVGFCGYGVQLVQDVEALRNYCASFPRGERLVIQEWLSQEGEAGIFYVRDPETDQSALIGLALRYFPSVVGDGRQSIDQLMSANQRLSRLRQAAHQLSVDGTRVPAFGEFVRLATIGSTRVGGLYKNGDAYITPQLVAAIDAIARDMPEFYFGRFDVRFDSLSELSQGAGFKIIEINGAGSEAIQAWDPATPLSQGLKMVFAKQRLLFQIGAARRGAGIKPIKLANLARLFWRQQQLIASYPLSN